MLDVVTLDYVFPGYHRPDTAANRTLGPWTYAVVGAGTPTVEASAGAMRLTLKNNNEIENASLFMGDVLGLPIDDLLSVEFWAARSATAYAAAVSACFGVASARNNDPDAIAASAWFRCKGNSNVVVETDDGVIDNNDHATGLAIGTEFRRYLIDFAAGVQTISPPSKSKGGKANVLFKAENARGQLVTLGETRLFDMSNYSGSLQLFAQIQKTAAVDVAELAIKRVRACYRHHA